MTTRANGLIRAPHSIHLTPGAEIQRVRRTSSGLRPVDSPAPTGSAVPASASGELLSRAPSPLKSPQSGEGYLPHRMAERVAPDGGTCVAIGAAR